MLSPEEYKKKLEILKQHCSFFGRNPDEIEKSIPIYVLIAENEGDVKEKLRKLALKRSIPDDYARKMIVGLPEQCIEITNDFVKAGVDRFMLMFDEETEEEKLDSIRLFADKVLQVF